MNFHEVRFPTEIARQSQGGPERRTDIVVLGSGHEERNTRWADSRRTYNAGYGVKSLDDLHAVIAFFEERRGRLYGFRWRDPSDWKSCPPESAPTPNDQVIGIGNGTTSTYPLYKTYGSTFAPWQRRIAKPVDGSILISVNGIERMTGTDYVTDPASGSIAFLTHAIPGSGEVVTAGFAFDVPVRFDTDRLEVSVQGFRHGAIPNIPIVEIRL